MLRHAVDELHESNLYRGRVLQIRKLECVVRVILFTARIVQEDEQVILGYGLAHLRVVIAKLLIAQGGRAAARPARLDVLADCQRQFSLVASRKTWRFFLVASRTLRRDILNSCETHEYSPPGSIKYLLSILCLQSIDYTIVTIIHKLPVLTTLSGSMQSIDSRQLAPKVLWNKGLHD